MKITLIVPAAALLLAGCASTTPSGDAGASASAQEERYVPIGTYLPRKRAQTANNASTVDKTDLENMKNSGNGTGVNQGMVR